MASDSAAKAGLAVPLSMQMDFLEGTLGAPVPLVVRDRRLLAEGNFSDAGAFGDLEVVPVTAVAGQDCFLGRIHPVPVRGHSAARTPAAAFP